MTQACKREGCSGTLFTEVTAVPCKKCKENGASVCRSCWVEIEHTCHLCGRGPRPVMLRRGELERAN